MCAESARKEAVAVRILHNVACLNAACRHYASHTFRPHIDVVFGISVNYRLARSAARCVNSDYLVLRNYLQTKRILVPEVVLGSKRQFCDVVDTLDVVGRDAKFVKFLLVKR